MKFKQQIKRLSVVLYQKLYEILSYKILQQAVFVNGEVVIFVNDKVYNLIKKQKGYYKKSDNEEYYDSKFGEIRVIYSAPPGKNEPVKNILLEWL
jgi:hypothetical protein